MSTVDLSTLSDNQRKIAQTLDSPLFVEAGAGSGKTFTLTQRIAWALSEGSGKDGRPFLDGLDQVLVITFTNAAAREIKERVRSTLRSAGMREQALQVDSAWISTIHGMCSRILKRHALDLGLDPEFRMASENEADILSAQALDEVVGAAYKSEDQTPGQRFLFDRYGLGKISEQPHTGALRIVEQFIEIAGQNPQGFDGLELVPGADVSQLMRRLLNAYEALNSQKLTKAALAKVTEPLELLRAFNELAPGKRTAEEARRILARIKEVKFPSTASKAFGTFAREVKDTYNEVWASILLSECVPAAQAALDLAKAADRRYAELKRDRSLMDNDDLVSLALAAVRDNPQVAADYDGRFRLIMVDEFQDTDERQLALIRLLAGGDMSRVCTGGDAQQSSYRFRGADVSVFRNYGASIGKDGHVYMTTNYRSHADVLSFVDMVCGGDQGVLRDFMHLDPSPKRKDGYVARDIPRIDVELVAGNTGTATASSYLLAQAVAQRFREYADAGESVGNMALLLGTTTHAGDYIDALRGQGLECVVTGGSTFTSAPEVQVMAALLHVLSNPHDTQSGLFPLLASEVFDLDADDFVMLGARRQVTLDAPTKRTIDQGFATMDFYGEREPSKRLRQAHEVLWRARRALRRLPVADVCLAVVRESGWLARLESQGQDGRSREANVLAAVDYIRDLTEELGLGPARAAQEFDRWLELAKIPPASLASSSQRALRIMTIHASKGLEFPVCAVCECWGDPRPQTGVVSGRLGGQTTKVVLYPKLGGKERLTLDGCETDEPQSIAEYLWALKDRNRQEEAQEKTRLLYVGLTRAREALILGVKGAVKKDGCGPELVAGLLGALFGGSFPAPGLHVLHDGEGRDFGRVRSVRLTKSKEGDISVDAGELVLPVAEAPYGDAEEGEPTSEKDGQRTYQLYDVEGIDLAKVTQLAPMRTGVFSFSSVHERLLRELEEQEAGEAAESGEGGQPQSEVRGGRRPSLPPQLPEDEEDGYSAAEDEDKATSLGSAFHELAQSLVEAPTRALAPARLDAMARRWNLSDRARGRLDAALARWCGSDLRAEALGHDRVRAEVPFFAQADAPYGDHVEGAIDLLATDGGSDAALVVDYKTGDRGLSPEEIRAHHELQANFYAYVLMGQGYRCVECAFCCVELDTSDLGGQAGQPYVVRYHFDRGNPPVL